MHRMPHRRPRVAVAQRDLRQSLLLAAAATVLALGMMAAAQAQTQATQAPPTLAPSQEPGSAAPPVIGRLRTVEQALHQSKSEVSGARQPNFPAARSTVEAGLRTIREVPQQAQGQQDWRMAQQKLEQVQKTLQGDHLDQCHGGEVAPHHLPVSGAETSEGGAVFFHVHDVPGEAGEVLRPTPCLCQDGENVPEGQRGLGDEALGEGAVRVPADLAANHHHLPAAHQKPLCGETGKAGS